MAITYPLNLIDDLPGWSTSFELLYRQETSRHASGRTRVKDFGTPIWTATYTTKNLSPNKLDYWRARLHSLENGLNTFWAYPLSRCWPISDPNGTLLQGSNGGSSLLLDFTQNEGYSVAAVPQIGNYNLIEIGSDRKTIRVGNVPTTFVFSIGDFIQIGNRLHQVIEGAVGSRRITITPHLSVGANLSDPVKLNKPSVEMYLVPGSASFSSGLNGRGAVSFQAIEARG